MGMLTYLFCCLTKKGISTRLDSLKEAEKRLRGGSIKSKEKEDSNLPSFWP
jgi:hypothetical protein